MPQPEPDDYYVRRAAQARQLADAASSVEARRVHEEMATIYDRLAGGAERPRPTLKLIP